MRRRLVLNAAATAIVGTAFTRHSVAAARLVVGQSLPLTGPLASYGLAKLSGSSAYFAQANRDTSNRRIEILALDDKYDSALTIENTYALVDKHRASALLGYFGVPTINAALPLFDQLKIPVVGLTSGSREIRQQVRPFVFPVRASYQVEIEKIVSHIKTVGFERVTVIAQRNAYGNEVKNTFLDLASASGIKEVSLLQLAEDLSNLVSVATGISANTQAIVLATLSVAAARLVKAMQTQKISKQIYGFSALDATYLYQALGTNATGIVQSQVVPSPNDNTKPVSRLYVETLKKYAPNEVPSYFGLEGFIEAKVLNEGIKRAGAAMTGINGRLALKTSLEQLGSVDLGGFMSEYSPIEHKGSTYVDLTILSRSGRTTH